MIGVFTITVSPWIIRNKTTFGVLDFSSAGWYNSNFPVSRFARQYGIQYSEPKMPPDFFPPEVKVGGREQYVFAYDFRNVPLYKQQFQRVVFERPVEYTLFHAQAMIRSLTGHDYEYLFEYVIQKKLKTFSPETGALFITAANSLWILLYVFAIFGLLFRPHRLWKVFLFILVVWNSFLVAMAGGSWGGRYNLPVAPMIFLLASYGMYAWYNMVKIFYVRHKRL